MPHDGGVRWIDIMNSRQRVLDTFAGKMPDKVPLFMAGISAYAGSIILGREAYIGGGIQQWREADAMWNSVAAHQEYIERSERDAWEVTLKTNQDVHRHAYWRVASKPIARKDQYTFTFGEADGAWWTLQFDPRTEMFQEVDRGGPLPPADADEVVASWPAQREQMEQSEAAVRGNAQQAIAALKRYGKEHIVQVGGGGIAIPYKNPAWLETVALRPDILAEYLDCQVQSALWQMDEMANAGAAMVWGGGDTASNRGPFCSPKVYDELLMPRWKQFAGACHDRGLYWSYASDGDLWPIADDLFKHAAIDGFFEIDRRAGMDLERLRKTYPNLTLIGNIASHTLHVGSVQDVIDETRDCIEKAKQFGHIIVGNSNYLMPGTPEANMWAMFETMEKYR